MTCDAKAKGCGGCPPIQLAYPEQLKKKQALVKKHLSTFGKPRPILGMADPAHYRNKAIATFAASKGGLISGIYREGSHRVIPVEECLLHAPDTDDVLRAVRETADVVFMDPPRTGSSEEFLSALCALSPKRVVYISCNVETQSRDLKYLHERGYKVRAIQPVDLFPHTGHVETVVLLPKNNG